MFAIVAIIFVINPFAGVFAFIGWIIWRIIKGAFKTPKRNNRCADEDIYDKWDEFDWWQDNQGL